MDVPEFQLADPQLELLPVQNVAETQTQPTGSSTPALQLVSPWEGRVRNTQWALYLYDKKDVRVRNKHACI